MVRQQLPAALGDEFSVAEALARGIRRGRLRGRDLTTPFRGARRRLGAGETGAHDDAVSAQDGEEWEDSPEQPHLAELERAEVWRRIRAYASIMPSHAFFIGPTAALIHGAPLPRGMHDMLHVGVLTPKHAPRRPGIKGRSVQPWMVCVVQRDGLPVSDEASTWAQLGEHLGDYDLVAVADYYVRIPRHPGGFRMPERGPYASIGDLLAALAAGRRRGAERLRRALPRVRTGSSSRPESWVRLALVDAGLPEPVIDFDVYDAYGDFIGCLDAAYPQARLGIEYEGDGHRKREQFEADIDRIGRFAENGWTILRVTSRHVFRQRHELIRRTRFFLNSSG